MNTFAETGLRAEILEAVAELGFETPTPIQAKAIPHLLTSDQDLIALAQTGTGKTAAFGLPAIHLTDVKAKTTQTLIMCPTRELCIQITKDLTIFAQYIKGLHVVAVYGGSSIQTQIQALKKGAQIVVGTPGRLKDLIKRKKLLLGTVTRVVLDEADEMLNMGFKEDMDAILAETPDTKQTLLFSATMSKEIARITKKFMKNPVEISAARKNIAAENVSHIFHMVQAKDRYEVIKRIADMNPDIYAIVFCRTRRETKEVSNKLMHDGYNADALHGDLSQAQRDDVMGRFRSHSLQILVATDVAARGLDVNDITHVINYNLPDDSEVYVHRSGRTGRAGKSGTSIAIIHTRESRRIREMENKFGVTFTKEPVPNGKDICKKQLLTLIDKIEKVEVDDKQIEPFLADIYAKLEWLSREELIKHFVSAEFNRFLSYYKNAKDINATEGRRNEKDGRRNEREDRRNGREDRRDSRVKVDRGRRSLSRLFINVGAKNQLNPARLIGLINEGLDSGDAEIGKIEILNNFSFFEIEDGMETPLIKALNGQQFEGVPLLLEVSTDKPAYTPTKKTKFSKSKKSDTRKEGGRADRKRRTESKQGDSKKWESKRGDSKRGDSKTSSKKRNRS